MSRSRGSAPKLLATLDAIRVGGGRVIVVDAIEDNAHEFYQHFGFRPIAANHDRLVIKARPPRPRSTSTPEPPRRERWWS